MTKQTLIINGVDWLDDRMIGLKCIFDNEHYSNLLEVREVSEGKFRFVTDYLSDREDSYDNCRLAQGEKTPYVGKGQPVPDGVIVEVVEEYDHEQTTVTTYAEKVRWDGVVFFTVQEQPLDTVTAPKLWGDRQDAQDVPPHIADMTLQNRTSILIDTKARVVEALTEYRELISVTKFSYASRKRRGYKSEMVHIANLIKELEHV